MTRRGKNTRETKDEAGEEKLATRHTQKVCKTKDEIQKQLTLDFYIRILFRGIVKIYHQEKIQKI